MHPVELPLWLQYVQPFAVPLGVVLAGLLAALVATWTKRRELREADAQAKVKAAERVIDVYGQARSLHYKFESADTDVNLTKDKDSERAARASIERLETGLFDLIQSLPSMLFGIHMNFGVAARNHADALAVWLEQSSFKAPEKTREWAEDTVARFEHYAAREIRATRRGAPWLSVYLLTTRNVGRKPLKDESIAE